MNLLSITFLLISITLCVDYRSTLASGYWQINVGEFDTTRGDKIMAFGDFNIDGYTDIVSVDSLTNLVVAINIWNPSSSKQSGYVDLFVRKELMTAANPVVSIITADMNFDGSPDLVYVEREEMTYDIKVGMVDGCVVNCGWTGLADPEAVLLNVDQVEPFVLDLHGARVPEIFFVRNGVRQHAALQNLTLTTVTFDSHVYNPVNSEGFPTFPDIQYPALTDHYASLVDINGDCMADLVLLSKNETSSFLEFYINLKNGLLKQPTFVEVSDKVKSISFTDVSKMGVNLDFDGANDLVLLCDDEGESTSYVEFHLNKYPGDAYSLCTEFSGFPYDFEPIEEGSIKRIQRIQLEGEVTEDPTMKFVDLNLDGYSDLIITLKTPTDPPTYQGHIYMNTQCYGEQCGTFNPAYTILANTSNLRYFARNSPATINTDNVTTVAVFDLYEDGIPDILVNQFVTKNVVGNVTYIKAILNNKQEDAFFTKILCLNGANTTAKVSASLPGACYEWVVTGLGGNYLPAVGTQGMQVAFRALPLPYMMSGLGRTNNYIEDFSVGIPSNTTLYSKSWSPVIPNTQLIVTPVAQDPSSWRLSMKIEPTEKLKMVLVFTILALVLVGMVIYYYHRKEQLENKENIDSFYVALS